jgi:hypothetical protein
MLDRNDFLGPCFASSIHCSRRSALLCWSMRWNRSSRSRALARSGTACQTIARMRAADFDGLSRSLVMARCRAWRFVPRSRARFPSFPRRPFRDGTQAAGEPREFHRAPQCRAVMAAIGPCCFRLCQERIERTHSARPIGRLRRRSSNGIKKTNYPPNCGLNRNPEPPMTEGEEAIELANKVLDDASRNPDRDLSMMARQFVRSEELIVLVRLELAQLVADRLKQD